jgi:general secretion pathway protein G
VEGFQARFVAVQVAAVVLCLLVFVVILMGPLVYRLLTEGSEVPPEVAERFLLLHGFIWSVVVAMSALLSALFLLMSHRVAGPLFRFRRAFKEISDGRLDIVVTTRKHDYLSAERDELNAMIAALRDKVGDAQRAVADSNRLLAECRTNGGAVSGADLARLEERGARATAALARFSASQGFTLIELLIGASIIAILAGLALPAYLSALEVARVARAAGDIRAIEKEVVLHFVAHGCFPGSLATIGRDTLLDPWGSSYQYGVVGSGASAANRGWDRRRNGPSVTDWRIRATPAVYAPSMNFRMVRVAQGGGGGNGRGGGSGGGNGGGGVGGSGGGGNGGSGSGGGSGGGPGGCTACSGTCLGNGKVRKDRNLHPLNRDFDLYSMGKDRKSVSPLTGGPSRDDVVRASNGSFVGLGKDY